MYVAAAVFRFQGFFLGVLGLVYSCGLELYICFFILCCVGKDPVRTGPVASGGCAALARKVQMGVLLIGKSERKGRRNWN